ncbi:hypothetical protein GW17_00048254 [Ensete ventricosum]|nr:hypothetical protein GW17_00048254 [Ensete ventricosum]
MAPWSKLEGQLAPLPLHRSLHHRDPRCSRRPPLVGHASVHDGPMALKVLLVTYESKGYQRLSPRCSSELITNLLTELRCSASSVLELRCSINLVPELCLTISPMLELHLVTSLVPELYCSASSIPKLCLIASSMPELRLVANPMLTRHSQSIARVMLLGQFNP